MVLKDYDSYDIYESTSPPSEDGVLEFEEEIQPCEGNLFKVRR